MRVTSICYSPMCGHTVIGQARTCPRCGGRMRAPGTSRSFGFMMMACGLAVTALMGGITYYLSPMLADPSVQIGPARVEADDGEARTILQLFWLVIAFGVAATAAGAFQLTTGRRYRFITFGVLAFGGMLFLAATTARWSLGG